MRVDEATDNPVSAEGLRIAVATATFNSSVTEGLRAGAIAFLEESGAAEILAVEVPGAFELPLMAQRLTSLGYDAVVCLGAVIEGETDHYEHVAHRASEGLMRVQLDTGVPITFGILTVRQLDDALARSKPGPGNKGREAAQAAVLTVRALQTLS
ncbi:MAG: 6,7-dimethyl-8-ribityllumazine synthase [Acidimicrobiia bacterium]|nr:MAG: 6,7-dimethyl-8-ribityllumazine synthase [Acidimicrobiia bacterium]